MFGVQSKILDAHVSQHCQQPVNVSPGYTSFSKCNKCIRIFPWIAEFNLAFDSFTCFFTSAQSLLTHYDDMHKM